MIREILNTLYVMTPDAFVRLDHDAVRVEVQGERLAQVPLLHLGGIALFGNASISSQAMQRCAEDGRAVTFFDYGGRFKARVVGPVCGNVLLRKAQYDAHGDETRTRTIAAAIVAGKLKNMQANLTRAGRDVKDSDAAGRLKTAASDVGSLVAALPQAASTDVVRGIEGQGSALYFEVFGDMLAVPADTFAFKVRTRRPPRDRVNALLSFLYSLLTTDCVSACEGVGLDPQFGFLHVLRPGRPSLALDLMEEFRPRLADRLALNLINRKQIRVEHFETREEAGESVMLNEDGRKIVITEYQNRKREDVLHPFLKDKAPYGLLPHLQARLLARYLRGDLENYIPFLGGD